MLIKVFSLKKMKGMIAMLERLENLPVGNFHYKLLIVTGIGWLFDSMDTGLISFVLPMLAKDWNLVPEQVGMIGSMGLFGMAIGAVMAGSLADRFGRKNIFAATVILYSIATGLCAVAWSYESLLVFRFLVGFGLGGELPVAATLVSEYAPAHLRGRFIVLLESFWALGWLVAALLSYFFLPVFGWKAAFLLGSLPALYIFVIRLHMPESVRYLISKGRVDEAEEIVTNIEQQINLEFAKKMNMDFAISNTEESTIIIKKHEPSEKKEHLLKNITESHELSPVTLFNHQFRVRTIMLWLTWFGIVFSYYGIFMWLPSIVYAQGFEVVKSFQYVLVMTLAQLPGYFTAAWLVDKVGRRYTLSSFLLMSGVCAFFFGNAATSTQLLISGAAMSFFNLGAWGVIYTYTPELYPTHIRALGSGYAAGFGRIGGIIAPALVGSMIASGFQFSIVFALVASVFVAISVVVLSLGLESKQMSLENIK